LLDCFTLILRLKGYGYFIRNSWSWIIACLRSRLICLFYTCWLTICLRRLLRYLLIKSILNTTWNRLSSSHCILSIFIRCWLNLSLRQSFLNPLRLCVITLRVSTTLSLLINFFILLIGTRRELHIITKLLFRRRRQILNINLILNIGKLSKIFNNFIWKQHFLNDFIIWPLMLEKWVIDFTSTGGINPDEVTFPVIF